MAALMMIMMSLLLYKGGKHYYSTFREYSTDSINLICSAIPEGF